MKSQDISIMHSKCTLQDLIDCNNRLHVLSLNLLWHIDIKRKWMYNTQLLVLSCVPSYMEHINFSSLLNSETTALNKVNKTQKCVIINHFQHSYMTKQHLQIGFGYLNRGINIFVEAGHSFFFPVGQIWQESF